MRWFWSRERDVSRRARQVEAPPTPWAGPMRIMEVELGAALPRITASVARNGSFYRRAHLLVRLHRWPLGVMTIALDPLDGTLDPESLAIQVWRRFSFAIVDHLVDDGVEPPNGLASDGLHTAGCTYPPRTSPAKPATVVVSTRDRPHHLAGCIEALLELEYPDHEIVIVDNAPSTSATAEVVQRFAGVPNLRYVCDPQPGLSHARNTGIRESRGEVIAFTDDDVRVDPLWLAALVGGFEAASNVGCVTGPILPAELEVPAHSWVEDWVGGDKTYRRRIFDLDRHRGRGPLYPYSFGKFGAGASMAFTAQALRHLGGFDPALGPPNPTRGGDDLDIFFRAVMGGMTLVHEPGAIVRHLPRPDYAALMRQIHDCGVGYTAVLTKCLLDRPGRVLELAPKVPLGFVQLLRARSDAGERLNLPRELVREEFKGMLVGPGSYIISRRRTPSRGTNR